MVSAGLAFLCWMVTASSSSYDDASVGESDAKDVAGEVLEHGLFAVAPGLVMSWRIQRLLHTASGMTRSGHFRRRRSRNLARTNLSRDADGHQEVPPAAGCQVVASTRIYRRR